MSTYYGTGADGDRVISSNWTMDRDYQWQNLTVNPGVTLDTAGRIIKIKETLTNNGTITDSYSGGAGGSGGGGGAGRAGDGNGSPGSNGSGGGAGSAGAGNGGTGGGGGGGGAGQSNTFVTTGGSGGSGGSGGKGGGVVIIYAKNFVNNATIHANGFSGGSGSGGGNGQIAGRLLDPMSGIFEDYASGGGGGGGGGNGGNAGSVSIIYQTRTVGTITAYGGGGGSGGAGGSGVDTRSPYPGGTEYVGGVGGSGGGNGGSGGAGEEGADASGNGGSGGTGATGAAGSIIWTFRAAYDDSGIRYCRNSAAVAIACEDLKSTHKLRFRKGSVIVGLPLVNVGDENASPWRIHDGTGIKAVARYI